MPPRSIGSCAASRTRGSSPRGGRRRSPAPLGGCTGRPSPAGTASSTWPAPCRTATSTSRTSFTVTVHSSPTAHAQGNASPWRPCHDDRRLSDPRRAVTARSCRSRPPRAGACSGAASRPAQARPRGVGPPRVTPDGRGAGPSCGRRSRRRAIVTPDPASRARWLVTPAVVSSVPSTSWRWSDRLVTRGPGGSRRPTALAAGHPRRPQARPPPPPVAPPPPPTG